MGKNMVKHKFKRKNNLSCSPIMDPVIMQNKQQLKQQQTLEGSHPLLNANPLEQEI